MLPPAMPFFRPVLATCVLLALVHVAIVAHVARAQPRERITLYAAASLKDAMDALLKGRENVNAIYAGSATLARQIEHGAPADIFVSADLDWMDYLEKKNLLRAGTRFNLLGNRIVLVVPKGSAVTDVPITAEGLSRALGGGCGLLTLEVRPLHGELLPGPLEHLEERVVVGRRGRRVLRADPDLVDLLDLPMPEEDDEPQPGGDVDLLSDHGMNSMELETLAADSDLFPDEQIEAIAWRLGFGEQFSELLS